MTGRSIRERVGALELAAPRVDPVVIEQGLREHLMLLNAPVCSFVHVGDAESAFETVARMVGRGWVAASPSGPRWTRRHGHRRELFTLWESRQYWTAGGGIPSWPSLDVEVVAAARRSALHWRRPARRRTGLVLPNPVVASQVALRAVWDEATAAKLLPEPERPGEFDSSASAEQKGTYWLRYDAWRKWFDSDERQAPERLSRAKPLVRAVEAGLFALFWLRKPNPKRSDRHACITVPRPTMLVASTGRSNTVELHAWDEPAVQWPDGPSYWYWHNIRIWRELADHPSRLTARYIARTRNMERRRVLLDRLGYERFLQTADAELIQQDDYGKLWRTEIELEGELVHVVEVLNSTPEPDGSSRRYFLRVPPRIRTARGAVAWTFSISRPTAYRPRVEA